MPARSASARIFASRARSFIGPKLLKSGSIQIGAISIIRNTKGMLASPAYNHQRRGLLRSAA